MWLGYCSKASGSGTPWETEKLQWTAKHLSKGAAQRGKSWQHSKEVVFGKPLAGFSNLSASEVTPSTAPDKVAQTHTAPHTYTHPIDPVYETTACFSCTPGCSPITSKGASFWMEAEYLGYKFPEEYEEQGSVMCPSPCCSPP